MELFTERMKLKDILPEKARDIAKEYKLKEDDIEFIRKKTPLKAEDLKIEDGERAAIRYVNTADLDRDNEIVLPSGGQVNDFKKSPTVLYAHDYRGLPIGKDIWIKLVQGKGWLAKTIYAKHQLASDVYNLVKEKFLNTSSIGFIPLESVKPDSKGWDKIKEKLTNEWGIPEKIVDKAKNIYTKWILLEHSDVPIPSNINALNVAVGKGLEIKSKELIDDLNIEIIDEKEEIELIEEDKKVVTKPEETEDFIHIPVIDASKFIKGSFRTIDIDKKKGIKAVIGKLKTDPQGSTKVQKFIFDKKPPHNWTMAKAKKWVVDHGKEYDNIDEKDFEIDAEEKGVIPFKETPKAPEGEKWDAGKEVREAEISDLKIMCTWFDSENPDIKTAYKLPHHKASGHSVVWRAVAAAMGALLGARGGVIIPTSDKKGVYNHLVKHYKQFGKEPPEFKEYTEEVLNILFPESKEGEGTLFTEEKTGYSLDELYEIIKENKELTVANIQLNELNEKLELKAGAVLNRKNKTDLTNAQKLIQNVLDSAETSEEGKETFNCECISCGYKMTSDKHCSELTCPKCGGEMRRAERPGPGKELDEIELDFEPDKKDEGIELDANEIKSIIKDVIKENVKGFKNEITKGIDDNFKRATGKVL